MATIDSAQVGLIALDISPPRQEGVMDNSIAGRGTIRGIVLLVAAVSLFGVVDGLSKVLVETQSFGQIGERAQVSHHP
jgi:hypothetical protein